MEKVAFINGGSFIYWSSIVMTIAVAAAAFAYLALYIRKSKNEVAALISLPMAIALSAVFGRLIHWYCRTDSYSSLQAAITDYSWGSYALSGVFAACLLTAVLLRLLRISKNLPEMLDSAALAVGIGIAVGRLSFFFNTSDKGLTVPEDWTLPMAFPVTNPVSGAVETRLATFLLQSIVTAAIVGILLLYTAANQGKKSRVRAGDVGLLFLAYYGCSQVFFDSTRYDSLFLRSNGFVSVVQILSAVGLVAAMGVFTFRLFKNGKRAATAVLWVLFLAFTGGAGYMEYYVQRHGDQAAFAYQVMVSCLFVMAVIITVAHIMAGLAAKPKKKGRFERQKAAKEDK